MQSIDLVVESPVPKTARVTQISGMFDVPLEEKTSREWHMEIPIDEEPWNIGLITGPSGCGKTVIARELFGESVDHPVAWNPTSAVVDDFSNELSIAEITDACSSVGFNTIPSWLKPYRVLSNGEQFRVDLARRLLEAPSPVVVDEFTSVVDRQVGKIASHAVQRFIRKTNRQFVAVSCHMDVIDWLQPDWIIRPDEGTFHRRRLRRRPEVTGTIARVDRSAWPMFAPFHYMSADLATAARCYCLFVNDAPVVFMGLLPRPISHGPNKGKVIWGISRVVTLPDWQGIGLAFTAMDSIGALYRSCGYRVAMYPAHPGFVHSFERNPRWRCRKKYGTFTRLVGAKSTLSDDRQHGSVGGRFNAVYDYVGEPLLKRPDAREIIMGKEGEKFTAQVNKFDQKTKGTK